MVEEVDLAEPCPEMLAFAVDEFRISAGDVAVTDGFRKDFQVVLFPDVVLVGERDEFTALNPRFFSFLKQRMDGNLDWYS